MHHSGWEQDNMKEADLVKTAIHQHQARIQELEKSISLHRSRIELLQSIDTDIFSGVREYESYLAAKKETDVIAQRIAEKKARETREKEAQKEKKEAEKEAEKEKKEAEKDKFAKIIKQIRDDWPEYFACWKADDHAEDSPWFWNGRERCELDLEKVISELRNIDQALGVSKIMVSYMAIMHKTHNDKLLLAVVCVECPRCHEPTFPCSYRCDNNKCGAKVYWDTSDVNFYKDVKMSDTYPVGRLVLF